METEAIHAAVELAAGSGMEQVMSLMLRMLAVPLGVLLAAAIFVSLLGITEDTANGFDVIESRPGVNFLDWIGESLFIAFNLFLISVPPFLAGQALRYFDVSWSVAWTTAGVVAFIVLTGFFPILLLASLESGSPFIPYSKPVFRSLRVASNTWRSFYFYSAPILLAVFAVVLLRVSWPLGGGGNFLLCLALIVALALYFRLLGRLAWCCQDAVAEAEEDAEAEESAAVSSD